MRRAPWPPPAPLPRARLSNNTAPAGAKCALPTSACAPGRPLPDRPQARMRAVSASTRAPRSAAPDRPRRLCHLTPSSARVRRPPSPGNAASPNALSPARPRVRSQCSLRALPSPHAPPAIQGPSPPVTRTWKPRQSKRRTCPWDRQPGVRGRGPRGLLYVSGPALQDRGCPGLSRSCSGQRRRAPIPSAGPAADAADRSPR